MAAKKTEIHVGDIGTMFKTTLKDDDIIVPIGLAITMLIIFTKPTIDDIPGEKIEHTAVHFTDGADGIMEYTTVDVNDLDVAGTWQIQGFVKLPTGEWSTNIDKFKVYENL